MAMIPLKLGMVVTLMVLLVAIPAVAQTTVDVDSPSNTPSEGNITVPIAVSDINNFDAGQFDILFDSSKAALLTIGNGTINGTAIPVALYAEIEPGRWRVILNVPGFPGVSGNGTLANLEFQSVSLAPGDTLAVSVENEFLNDNEAQEIPAEWAGGETLVYLRGDASGDGRINTSDITKIERIILMMDAETIGADINLDTHVNTSDVTLCERIILGYD